MTLNKTAAQTLYSRLIDISLSESRAAGRALEMKDYGLFDSHRDRVEHLEKVIERVQQVLEALIEMEANQPGTLKRRELLVKAREMALPLFDEPLANPLFFEEFVI